MATSHTTVASESATRSMDSAMFQERFEAIVRNVEQVIKGKTAPSAW